MSSDDQSKTTSAAPPLAERLPTDDTLPDGITRVDASRYIVGPYTYDSLPHALAANRRRLAKLQQAD